MSEQSECVRARFAFEGETKREPFSYIHVTVTSQGRHGDVLGVSILGMRLAVSR
jgi:hypothetical protein